MFLDDNLNEWGNIWCRSFEIYFEHFPLLYQKLAFGVPREGETGLRWPDILAVVVTNRELRIRSFLIAVIDNADIAAAEDGTLIGVVGYRKLSQVQVEFLPHIQRKDKTFHRLVCGPLLLCGTPAYRSVASDDLSELGFHQSQSTCLSVTFFMELFYWKGIFGGPEQELEGGNFGLEESLDGGDIVDDFTWEYGW